MSLGRAAAGSVASTLLGTLFLAIAGIITARSLGPEGRGLFVFAVLVPNLVASACTLGLTNSLVYFIARERRDPGAALGTSLAIALALGLGCVWIFLLLLRARWWPAGSVPCLAITVWAIPAILGYSMARHALLGLQRYLPFNLLNLTNNGILAVLFLAALLGPGGSLRTFCALFTAGSVLSFIAALALALSATGRPRVEGAYARAALHYGLRSHVGWLAELLNYRLDMLIVQALGGARSLGLYSVAVSIAETLWLVPSCVSVVLMPELASVGANQTPTTTTICRLIFSLTLVAAGILAALGAPLVTLLYGAPFRPALWPLLLLLPGVAVFSLAKVLGADFAARGKPGLASQVAGVSLAVTLVLDLALIPRYEAAGAALASSMAYGVAGALAMRLYARLTGVGAEGLLLARRADLRVAWTVFHRLTGRPPAAHAAAGEEVS